MGAIINYCKNVFQRSFLYQVLISFAVFHLINAYLYYRDFQKNLVELFGDLGLKELLKDLLQSLKKNSEINYKIYNISLIVFAGFAILNIPYLKFFRLFGGFASIISAFIFHNPISTLDKYMKSKESFERIGYYLPETEFFLLITLGVAMIAHFFKPEEEPIAIKKPIETPKAPKTLERKAPKKEEKPKETPAPNKEEKKVAENTPRGDKKKKKKKN